MDICAAVKQKFCELGFDLVGITDGSQIQASDAENLRKWIDNGLFGSMEYMARNLDKRIDPTKLFENAASVICAGLIYKPVETQEPEKPNLCRVSDYAGYNDYHDYMRDKLRLLADFLHQIALPEKIRTKVCVDTAPVAERALAVRAGLGFVGKNHMLINPQAGVEIFLGSIITDLKLETDCAVERGCGDCSKCIDACPTGALNKNGTFNANKCISYLTIEHKSEIPEHLAAKIGNSIYGCDRCVHVCPYHIKGQAAKDNGLTPRPENKWLDPQEILKWDNETFEKRFASTPIHRIGLDRLKRNAKVCLENLNR